MSQQWTICDTSVDCLMGDERGPNVYSDERLAKAAATIVTDMFDAQPGRFLVVPFTPSDGRRIRDSIEAERTGIESIRRVEAREWTTRRLVRKHRESVADAIAAKHPGIARGE